MSQTLAAERTDTGALQSFAYDNRIVRDFIVATMVWGLVGMLVGVIVALQLAFPALNVEIPWLTYGRLRPLHTNAVIFAFAGNAIFAGIYYSSQRLLKARMFCDKLSRFHFWGWQAIIVAAAITLPLGITTSKEYAELEWPIDIAIAVVWLAFGANLIGTIFTRRERHLYVAIWFYLATVLAITMLHVVNSLALPVTLFHSYSLYAGAQDALVQWWYGHNAVAFFLTTPFLGLMYYFLPKAAERPVYSYRLSIVHFWSLVFLYIWAGPHHLLNSATPEWAQTLGVIFSVMLIAPSWGGLVNGFMTLRGAWHRVRQEVVLKFFVAAIAFYGLATFEGCMLSLRSINALSHNTEWTIGHVHGGALGWNGLLIFAMFYWLVPRLWRTPLWSTTMANWHFWLALIGIKLYLLAMWVSGIMQGVMQLAFDDNGRLMYADWMEIIRMTIPWYWVRAVGGVLYLLGVVLCAINLWRTATSGTLLAEEQAQAPALLPETDHLPQVQQALAQPGMRARTSALHGLIERWPLALIILSGITMTIGGAFQIIPSLIQGAVTPPIASVRPYTPLELTGRDLYIREGCSGCHTQLVRTLRAETERYQGEYTRMGEHIYDRPFLWGSKRTGPDLAREGLIRPDPAWHYRHFTDPQGMVPGTIMPSYAWLARDDMDLSTVSRKLAVLASPPLYTPYTATDIANAEADARAQAMAIAERLKGMPGVDDHTALANKEVIALIAYLQRLGRDLHHAAPTVGASGR
jgi:cytochrome c oxidase cbb3-type subunit I/II